MTLYIGSRPVRTYNHIMNRFCTTLALSSAIMPFIEQQIRSIVLILRSEYHDETAAGLHGNGDGGVVTGDG